ncbi:MAG: hypothetical protein IKK85_02730 [Clostridia bacterium]|nr:hypothetical protein [Clostridia bacterium]
MKKLLALLMALAMVFTFAACGGDDVADETTTAPVVEDDSTVAADAPVEESSAAEVESTEAPSEVESTEAESTEAATEEVESTEEAAPAGDMTAAEFAAFMNAETAKIAKSGKYTANRECKYTNPIDVGGATDILNKIIMAIDENSNLDTVVGDFLGIGTKKANIPAEDMDSDYKIKATSLKPEDLGSFAAKDGVYTFTLANATDPKKTGATPFNRFTNDFITHEEVVDGIAEFTTAIKVNSTTVNYKNIKVEVKVVDGKISNIKYSYAFDATLALKAVVTINGSGAAVTNGVYSNIKY